MWNACTSVVLNTGAWEQKEGNDNCTSVVLNTGAWEQKEENDNLGRGKGQAEKREYQVQTKIRNSIGRTIAYA